MKFFKKILVRILIGIIRLYQGAISPFFRASCRFTPSCSQYGIEAIKKYGPLKGTYLTIKRLSRCHPWGGHGYDPLP
ncbi:MAG: membrane protein insertion efficiency factor YidD [Bacteroidetes bacterium]|nr:MAG: membrane protein insertion efficiency factor YidD [Bacteroidota bacterium]